MSQIGSIKIVADENIPFVKQAFESIGSVRLIPGRKITSATVADADILLVRSVTKVNEQLIGNSNVKMVATATIGTDHIDEEYLRRSGISFASAAGCNANSVAEYVIVALLELACRYDIALKGKVIGVIGVGNVGSKVAAKAEALGLKVLRNDPPLKEQTNDEQYIELIELLKNSDFVTLHTPLTTKGKWPTFHLANDNFFSNLKPNAYFFNTARGAIVDTLALKRSLKNRNISATVIDVWENEPEIDLELLDMSAIATPHIAGYSFDGKVVGTQMIYEAVCRFLDVKPKWNYKLTMPAPSVPMLKVEMTSEKFETNILNVVKKIYDITEDDRKLREIKSYPKDKRGKYFDQLRKNYPIRREFFNTRLVFDDNVEPSVKSALLNLGFQLAEE